MDAGIDPRAESPLKGWVQRHSPLKTRNNDIKPLPRTLLNSSPTRKPMTTVFGNKSPPKQSQSRSQTQKPSNKLLSLLRPKSRSTHAPLPIQPIEENTIPTTPPRRRHLLSTKTRTPDLRTLSRKVSNLEAQLKEARRELDIVVGTSTSPHTTAATSASLARSPSSSDEVDREIEHRQATLSQRGRFDGLVENLLGQSNNNTTNLIPTQIRPATRRGPAAAIADAWQDYQSSSSGFAYTPTLSSPDNSNALASANPHSGPRKRKHDDASWQQMQDRIAEFQLLQQTRQPGAKRARGPDEFQLLQEAQQQQTGAKKARDPTLLIVPELVEQPENHLLQRKPQTPQTQQQPGARKGRGPTLSIVPEQFEWNDEEIF